MYSVTRAVSKEVTNMRKAFIITFLAVFALLFITAACVDAAPVGKITKLEGRVDVLKAGQRSVTPVSLGGNVDVGDIYRTKTDGRAEITFFNKNILRIAPATRVQVSRYSDDGTRSNQIMKLERGRVQAISGEEFIKKVSTFAEGNKFEVHTPNAVAGIRGSGMTTGFTQMITGLFFHTGRGYFYNPLAPGRVVNVSGGFMSFIVGIGGTPSYPVRGNVAYVAGSGFAPGGTGNGSTGNNLNNMVNFQNTAFDQTYVFTQQPIVPSVLVGTVPHLSGMYGDSYSGLGISINNVKFYGPTMTGVPQSWVADSVTGSYWNFDKGPGSFSFPVSGSGLSANVTVSGDDADYYGNWSAAITNGTAPSGVGTCTQPFTFSGSAAGTFSGSVIGTGTITGVASGTASQPLQIPNVYVGNIQYLEGSNGSIFVMLNDVKFYGPSMTSVPQSWSTNSISGSVFSPPPSGTVSLTGPTTQSAQLIVTGSTASTISANITNGSAPSGVGSYTGPVAFSGTASMTYGAGSISGGTASGTAH